jgi:hypothetical protein
MKEKKKMKSISNNNNNTERPCKYGCGKLIKWDKSQNAYIEIDTNIRHRCPNWNSKQEHPIEVVNHRITTEQQLYADTIGPAIAEILSLVQEIYEKMFPKEEGV